jgi:hypothetical protein
MHLKKDAKIGKNTCTRSSFKCWNPRSFRGAKSPDPPTRLCPDPAGDLGGPCILRLFWMIHQNKHSGFSFCFWTTDESRITKDGRHAGAAQVPCWVRAKPGGGIRGLRPPEAPRISAFEGASGTCIFNFYVSFCTQVTCLTWPISILPQGADLTCLRHLGVHVLEFFVESGWLSLWHIIMLLCI